MKLRKIGKLITENLFPQNFTCELCGIEIFNGRLCPDCAETVVLNNGETCPVCGRKTCKSEICIECKAHTPEFKKAVSAMNYSGGAVRLISMFKQGKAYLAGYFSELLIPKIKTFPTLDGLVYVPMTAKSVKKRGYNQSRVLAERISEAMGIPVLKEAVAKDKDTPEQKCLSRDERLKNLIKCFKADKNSVNGKSILIIDDVLTTGATLDAVCAKLKKAGAKEVYAATAASVEYTPYTPALSED